MTKNINRSITIFIQLSDLFCYDKLIYKSTNFKVLSFLSHVAMF